MLAEGRSLSGREPNSCFLNLGRKGTPKFSDVSAATGFNFSDDSRSLGFIDWDFDGDLDVWMLNRSAPTVRFLKNEQTSHNQFVSLLLTGKTSNRNAIGARAIITTADSNGEQLSQFRTVTAGGSYLSQSSRWLHFGLGQSSKILSLKIIWPHGETQTFGSLESNRFYTLTEGQKPVPWNPPSSNRSPLLPGELEAPPVTNRARIVLGNRPLFPPLQQETIDGKSITSTQTPEQKPRLVFLWSATCPDCHEELAHWTAEHAKVPESKLDVLLLNVDPRDEGIQSQINLASSKIAELNLPFTCHLLSPEEVGAAEAFQQANCAIQLPLMTPTSFLLDQLGRVAVIYRGTTSLDQIVADLEILDLRGEALVSASVPYSGRWWKIPLGADASKSALRMHDAGLTPQAVRYLEAELKNVQDGSYPARSRPPHELYFTLARLRLKSNDAEKAIAAYHKALELEPDHRLSNQDLGRILYDSGSFEEALPFVQKSLLLEPDNSEIRNLLIYTALRINENDLALKATDEGLKQSPNDTNFLFSRGLIFQKLARWSEAINSYEQTVRLDNSHLIARNNLAWIFATADDDEIRDSRLSLHLVKPLLKAPGPDRALFLRTAAAATAESGEFTRAMDLINEALRIAPDNLIPQLKNDLAEFKKGSPIRSRKQ